MKKILALCLSCLLLFSFAACGAGHTIVDNNGKTQTVTGSELAKEYLTNSAAFNQQYRGAEFSGILTVENVSMFDSLLYPLSNPLDFCAVSIKTYTIFCKEGWAVEIADRSKYKDFLAGLKEGDKIRVKANIGYPFNSNPLNREVKYMSLFGVWKDWQHTSGNDAYKMACQIEIEKVS